MTTARPHADQIRQLGAAPEMDLNMNEAVEFPELMNGNLDIYETLDGVPDDPPPVNYPRTPGKRPTAEDTLYNAWYRQTDIAGAPDGVLAGQRVVFIVARALEMVPNTPAFDLTGHPSLSLPCGEVHGLPVGLMVSGRHFDEATVYRPARAFEQSSH